MTNHTDIPIFFIVSKGRSGSTLLVNLLDSNPCVSVPLESTFLIHLYSKYKYVATWNKETVDEYLIDLYRLRKIRKRWKLNKEELRSKLYALVDSGNASYGAVSKLIYLSYQSIYEKEEILLVGDKNPIYSFSIKKIQEIYPDAKFIHLVRDARANVRSHIISFNVKFLSFIAFKWHYYNEEIEQRKKEAPTNFYTVKYESLVDTPEIILKDISSFLNIEYSPESLDFHKKVEDKYGKYEKYQSGVHANLTKPIDKNLGSKWKTFFTPEKQNVINVICEKYLKIYGYEYSIDSINLSQRVAILAGKIYYKLWIGLVNGFYNSPFIVKKIAFKIIKVLFK